MPNKEDKKKGLIIMLLSAAVFIFLFSYFNLSGAKISNENIPLLLKALFTVAVLIFGLWFGLYFTSGKKIAAQIGGGLTIFMLITFVIGFLIH